MTDYEPKYTFDYKITSPKKSTMAVEKICECNNYIIVNKPYDMYINSDDENEKNTVTYHIAATDSHLSTSKQPLHFVHRLDFATSGVLCIAKNKTSAALAGKLFEKRLARKYYLAVVMGHTTDELLDIKFKICADSLTAHSSHRMVALTDHVTSQQSFEGQPRDAHTRMLLMETGYYDREPVSVVLLKPVTGRRHQLRVHCAAIGHTIRGDYTYSNALDDAPHRMLLHAKRLVLPFKTNPLDIQTQEPFFSDPQFSAKWKPCKEYYKYKTKEDFISVCDLIDKSYVLGVKYKLIQGYH